VHAQGWRLDDTDTSTNPLAPWRTISRIACPWSLGLSAPELSVGCAGQLQLLKQKYVLSCAFINRYLPSGTSRSGPAVTVATADGSSRFAVVLTTASDVGLLAGDAEATGVGVGAPGVLAGHSASVSALRAIITIVK
jgi:hypothetical protein